MKYVIGIDSGATSSEAILYPLNGGNVKPALKKYQPVNISILGVNESSKRIAGIIKDISRKAGINNIVSVTAGISGARYNNDRKKIEKYIIASTGINRIKITADTETAFHSAFSINERNCGILIAGTGSVLYYKDSKGKTEKIGGWGRHIGDEGSGYWIAREALYHITKFYDGRAKDTLLCRYLKKEFGINKENIVKKVYHKGFEISKLTRFVFRAAEKKDKAAIEIINKAAEVLTSHFEPLKRKSVSIALTGSLFTEEKLLEKDLRTMVKKKYPNITIVKTNQKPVWGAVNIALINIK